MAVGRDFTGHVPILHVWPALAQEIRASRARTGTAQNVFMDEGSNYFEGGGVYNPIITIPIGYLLLSPALSFHFVFRRRNII
jgi:hypothetical protein